MFKGTVINSVWADMCLKKVEHKAKILLIADFLTRLLELTLLTYITKTTKLSNIISI